MGQENKNNGPRIVCRACGKQYRWKPELTGRKVKCGCGQVMQISQDAPPAPGDELYNVVPDDGGGTRPATRSAAVAGIAARASSGSATNACPSCGGAMAAEAVICIDCGYDTRSGMKLGVAPAPAVAAAAPTADSPAPWVYRRKGLTQEAPVEAQPSALRDLVLPSLLIPLGVFLCFYAEMHRKDTAQSLQHVTPVVVSGMMISIGFMLGGMFLAAAIGGVAFADKPRVTVLKTCAVALVPGALAAIVDPMVGGINGNIVGNLAAVGLYWGLFALLFRLPGQDTVICVMIVWIIRVAVAYGMYKLEEFRSGSWI